MTLKTCITTLLMIIAQTWQCDVENLNISSQDIAVTIAHKHSIALFAYNSAVDKVSTAKINIVHKQYFFTEHIGHVFHHIQLYFVDVL